MNRSSYFRAGPQGAPPREPGRAPPVCGWVQEHTPYREDPMTRSFLPPVALMFLACSEQVAPDVGPPTDPEVGGEASSHTLATLVLGKEHLSPITPGRVGWTTTWIVSSRPCWAE